MKFIIALAVLVAVAAAAPPTSDRDAQIVAQSNEINPDGSYANSQQTSNKISSEESGKLKQVPNAEQPSISASGKFSFIAPDGITYTISYIADENGFQPQGAHIPQAP